ncbi:hypothetical protein FQA39_LY01044 [Lamprigera yunnana]|nr:hypothetical protein FQA39_LY01044 [Lamprigera yunnana]
MREKDEDPAEAHHYHQRGNPKRTKRREGDRHRRGAVQQKEQGKGTENSSYAKRDTREPESQTESTTGTPTAQLRLGIKTGKQRPTTGTTGNEKDNGQEQYKCEGSELEGAPNEDGFRTPSEMKAPSPNCTEDQDYSESKDWSAFVHNYQCIISKIPDDSTTITVAPRKRARPAMEEIRDRCWCESAMETTKIDPQRQLGDHSSPPRTRRLRQFRTKDPAAPTSWQISNIMTHSTDGESEPKYRDTSGDTQSSEDKTTQSRQRRRKGPNTHNLLKKLTEIEDIVIALGITPSSKFNKTDARNQTGLCLSIATMEGKITGQGKVNKAPAHLAGNPGKDQNKYGEQPTIYARVEPVMWHKNR